MQPFCLIKVLCLSKLFVILRKRVPENVSKLTEPLTMQASDKKRYPAENIKLAQFAKALGHPARIAILRHLASLETCRFTDISNELSLANSTVYQHLTELKRAGLIQGCIDPPKLQYCINYENWKLLRKHFREFAEIQIVKYEESKQALLSE